MIQHIERNKIGEVNYIQFDTMPHLTLFNSIKEVEVWSGKHYYFSEELHFPCWGFEVEWRCSSDYYFLDKETLETLLKFGDIKNA